MKFFYWPIKGRMHPIRLFLAFLALKHTEVPMTPDSWKAEKQSTPMDFPNLPFVEDGNLRLSESRAIPVYIALKAKRENLVGVGLNRVLHDQVMGVLDDLIVESFKFLKSPPELSSAIFNYHYTPNVKSTLSKLNNFLGKKKWLLGEITYADFYLAYNVEICMDISRAFNSDVLLKDLTALKEHHARFRELPAVKDFYAASQGPNQLPYLPASMQTVYVPPTI